jgi:flagellar biosynthetic protein FlhB
MAEESGSGEKTQAATAKRQQMARDEGNVPLSREAVQFAGLAAGGAMLWLAGPKLADAMLHRLGVLLQEAFRLDPAAGLASALHAMVWTAAPFVLIALAAAVVATFAQTSFLVHGGALMPNLGRLNPMSGLKRVLGPQTLMEAGKSLLKLGILFLLGRSAMTALLPGLPALLWHDPAALAPRLFAVIMKLGMTGIGVQAGFTAVDLGIVRFRHARSLRMSREDIRQEHKDAEGDPHIKGKLRRLRMIRSRKRMMAAVPTATVVVTNPTHYAVALFYDRASGGAPRVVAKGTDHVAARIREIAQDNRVPLVANPPLARALHEVEVDAEIPAEHFQAVAGIIAYIWGLDRRARPRL